jgi:FixJ family two-component response regulator
MDYPSLGLVTANLMMLVSIVDDDLSVRRALRRLIASAGFSVETFASGREFLESVLIGRSQCIVLDIHLGGLSGFDVQERLKAMGVQAPVILITAHDDEATHARAGGSGAAGYLRKPFEERALLDAIERAIGKADQP